MIEPKHTPTPWVVRSEMPTDCSDGTRWTIVHDQPYYDRPTRFIASMCGTMPTIEGESESNAALIVRAVNAHDALVSALERALRECDEKRWPAGAAIGGEYREFEVVKAMRAALRAAKGEQ